MIQFPKVNMIAMGLGLLTLAACSSSPKIQSAAQDSPAYQAALDGAFADLEAHQRPRAPAATSEEATFSSQFQKTHSFQVLVYSKRGLLPEQRKTKNKGPLSIQLDKTPAVFQFRIDQQGKCAQGVKDGLVSPADVDNCVQVEIKPQRDSEKRQYVRVFMDTNYTIYGISYHDYDNKTGKVKRERRKMKWDPSEPLSSELLSLSQDIVPLDLPIHATNHFQRKIGNLPIPLGPRAKQKCQGVQYQHRNTYGSFIQTTWCESDPWPTYVDTNRYVAVLQATGKAGGK